MLSFAGNARRLKRSGYGTKVKGLPFGSPWNRLAFWQESPRPAAGSRLSHLQPGLENQVLQWLWKNTRHTPFLDPQQVERERFPGGLAVRRNTLRPPLVPSCHEGRERPKLRAPSESPVRLGHQGRGRAASESAEGCYDFWAALRSPAKSLTFSGLNRATWAKSHAGKINMGIALPSSSEPVKLGETLGAQRDRRGWRRVQQSFKMQPFPIHCSTQIK